MAKVIEDLSNERQRWLIYGKAGNEKTRFAASATYVEGLSPVLLLTWGGNPVSIRSYEPKPRIVELSRLADFDLIYDWLIQGQPENDIGKRLAVGQPFKTVIVDGATRVNYAVMDIVMGNTNGGHFSEIEKDTEPGHYKKSNAHMLYWANLFYSLADNANKLPLHVMMTALEHNPAMDIRSEKAKLNGAKPPSPENQKYRPMFFGQTTSLMESMAYIVCRMISVEYAPRGLKIPQSTAHVALFAEGADYVAKDQWSDGKLGPYLVEPTMQKVHDLVFGRQPNPTTEKETQ